MGVVSERPLKWYVDACRVPQDFITYSSGAELIIKCSYIPYILEMYLQRERDRELSHVRPDSHESLERERRRVNKPAGTNIADVYRGKSDKRKRTNQTAQTEKPAEKAKELSHLRPDSYMYMLQPDFKPLTGL